MPRKILTWFLPAQVVFLGWRFTRPMNILFVPDAFENTISTINAPELLGALPAEECAACHQDIYREWQTTIHSQAWTDPYFQTDWQFAGSQQICKNCHTPLDRQQEHITLGFRDSEKWDPVLAPNPDFDPDLQHEGVTCAACHLRDGKIVGVLGTPDAPHPVRQLDDPNEVCVGCHAGSHAAMNSQFLQTAGNERWLLRRWCVITCWMKSGASGLAIRTRTRFPMKCSGNDSH